MKHTKFYLIISLMLILMVSLTFIGCSDAAKKGVTRIRVGYFPVVNALPLFLALDKGYFEDEGIEVEAVKFDSPNQIVDALALGQIDFVQQAALGIAGISEYKNPGKIGIFAVSGGTKELPNENLLAPINSSINSVADLRGKKLGILSGTVQWRTITRHILAEYNLSFDTDVIIVELATGLQAQALASGQIDALLALEPVPTIVKTKNIGKEIMHGPAEQLIADPFYAGAGLVNLEFAGKNPELTKKVVDIFSHSMEEITSDPDASRVYLKGYTPLDEDIVAQVPITIFKSCENFDSHDMEALQSFYDIFSKYKIVDSKIDVKRLIYCSK